MNVGLFVRKPSATPLHDYVPPVPETYSQTVLSQPPGDKRSAVVEDRL